MTRVFATNLWHFLMPKKIQLVLLYTEKWHGTVAAFLIVGHILLVKPPAVSAARLKKIKMVAVSM